MAGVSSKDMERETVGFYDLLGGPVLFIANDGQRLTLSRGPAAGDLPLPQTTPVDAGPVSIGRILSGAPGYPVEGGSPGRTRDGEWVLEEGRQKLFSDPSRRFIARAEYSFRGKRAAVSYPGRKSAGAPASVTIEMDGAKVLMRRDAE
jgi:hypothetical protein